MASSSGSRVGEDVRPLLESFERIGSPWRLVVLHSLHGEEMRFNELKRSIGADSGTLSRALGDLEEEELVDSWIEEADPVASYYTLTEKGQALQPTLESLAEWGDEWVKSEE